MYPYVLALHNLMRWVFLILAVVAAVRAFMGWLGKREWTETDRKVGSFTGIAGDIQLLLGLLLYFILSPITTAALRDFGAAMSSPEMRFFAVEHVLYMVLAVVSAHLGSILARKAQDPSSKFKRAALWFTLTVLFVLLGMPWMRPLLPHL